MMKYYKGVLAIKARKGPERERIIYTRGEDITTVMEVSHKIKFAKWVAIREIDRDTYIRGVQANTY
jgi:hypothetical protein